jgi:hypothetical protein
MNRRSFLSTLALNVLGTTVGYCGALLILHAVLLDEGLKQHTVISISVMAGVLMRGAYATMVKE